MKANRKFIEGDERAVSAVIGVILMVAITVAIAATVYVYVSGMLGGGAQKAPDMAFNQATTGTLGLTLVSADSGMTWVDFQIMEKVGTGAAAEINPYAGTVAVEAGQFIPVTTQPVVSNTVITVRHITTNTLMGTWTWYA